MLQKKIMLSYKAGKQIFGYSCFHHNSEYMSVTCNFADFFFLKCNFCKPITYIPTQPNPVVAELCHSHYGTRYMGKELGTTPRR